MEQNSRQITPTPPADILDRDWQAMTGALRGFVARRVPEGLVDDVLQECLVRIVEKLPALRNPASLTSWMFQIARRVIVDVYRTRLREPLPLDIEALESPEEDDEIMRELSQCVHPMLAALPEPYRETVHLADLENLSHDEIAHRQKLSLAGVRSRLARGRAMLRKHFDACCRFHYNRSGQIFDYTEKNGCTDC